MTTAAPATSRLETSARAGRPRLERRLLIAVVVLCALGIGDAAYLTYTHYAGLKVACAFHGSCETVQASQWSKLDGVPVSLLGLIGYIGILALSFLRSELARAGAFGLSLIGFGFSMYLTYRELFTIHAICQWCVGSAVFMTGLLVLTAIRFLRA